MGNGSIQSCNCFKQFAEKRQNYNYGDKLLVFVVKKEFPALVVIVAHPAGNQSQSSILLSSPKENNGNNETHLYSVL